MMKIERVYKFYTTLMLLALCVASLGACDFYHPSYMTQERLQVTQDNKGITVSVDELDQARINRIAKEYLKNSDGDLYLTVAYDPASPTVSQSVAEKAANRLGGQFKKAGVQNIRSNVMPVNGIGRECKALITYDAYVAHAPNCDMMPGTVFTDTGAEADLDYELGCSVETLFSRQIANPKDLLGNDPDYSVGSARRSGALNEPYSAGIPNQSLGGESSVN